MTSTVTPGYWTVRDLSNYLQIPASTIYWWLSREDGPPAIRVGKHVRFEPDAVKKWIQARDYVPRPRT